MNALSYTFSELYQYLIKPIAAIIRVLIDWILIGLFVLNLVALISIVLFIEIAFILYLSEHLSWISSYQFVLTQPTSFLFILVISGLLIGFSLFHVRSTKQSLLGWINSHRLIQFFNAQSKPNVEKVIKNDQYWANFYFQRAEKFRYGYDVDINMEYAIKLYQAAAKLEQVQAQVALSYLLLVYCPSASQSSQNSTSHPGKNHGKSNRDKKLCMSEAHNWGLKAAMKNEPGAWFNLGHMYKHGLGTPVSQVKALNAFEQAIYHGFYHIEQSGAAFYELGMLYLNGQEIGKNLPKAIKWLTKAAGAEYKGAEKALKMAYQESQRKDSKQTHQEKNTSQSNHSKPNSTHNGNQNQNQHSSQSGRTQQKNQYESEQQSSKKHSHKKHNKQKQHNQKQSNQKQSRDKKQPSKISCPHCAQDLWIPEPIPKGNAVCVKCQHKFRVKKDPHENIHVYSVEKQFIDQGKLPETEQEAREVLSLMTNDSATIIRRVYKAKMRDYHPDKVNKLGKKIKVLAEHESKRINAAYDLLKNTA